QELHLPTIEIPVTIQRTYSISPPSTTFPSHDHYLSNLDDMIGVRVFTPTVYFYRSTPGDDSVFRVLRESLVRVLVPYYPFTGRIRETPDGKKLQLFFDSEEGGALFVEARSDAALSDLGDLSVPNPAWKRLVYSFSGEEQYEVVNMPLIIAQVTRFRCGGFSLGLRLCHCLCDGIGAMQFVAAWAETAKSDSLTVDPIPCWNREVFRPRQPPRIEFDHSEFKRIEEGSSLTKRLWEGKVLQKCYKLCREHQNRLKSVAGFSGCTTFDATAAHVWRSWVRAMEIEPRDSKLRLTFSVNAREKLKSSPLPRGFYGNVLCVACAMSTAEGLVDGGLPEAARIVNEARVKVSEEYVRSTIDYIDVYRPKNLEFGGKLSITQWTRFPIYESGDFGWGRPIYAGPMDLTPTPQVCVFLPGGNDAMLLCICLPEYASQRF
ncbi:hypothetical protein M569_09214, partial [Genlisea aurea]